MKKRAIFQITNHLLVAMFQAFQKQGDQWRVFRVLKNALPDDAKPIRCNVMNNGNIGILIESESFEEIPATKLYPILDPPVFEVRVQDGLIDEVEYKQKERL